MKFSSIVVLPLLMKSTYGIVPGCQRFRLPDEVLVSTTANERATSYTTGLGSVSVTTEGELVATYNGNEIYRSNCVCSGMNCAHDGMYEVKLQIDGNLAVVPKDKKNAYRVWKSHKWMDEDPDQTSLVVDEKSLQVWAYDGSIKCYNKIWDSNEDVDTPQCSGTISTTSGHSSGNTMDANNSGCLDGIKVITTSNQQDNLPLYENDGAKIEVTTKGDLICKDGNDVIYQSNCKCTKQEHHFVRNLHQCMDPYVIKFQGDGNFFVVDKDGDRHWKTNKRSDDHGKYAMVVNDNKCQVWKLDYNHCPANLLWDSGNSHDTNGVKCDGYQH
jgi:hypothetical protein